LSFSRTNDWNDRSRLRRINLRSGTLFLRCEGGGDRDLPHGNYSLRIRAALILFFGIYVLFAVLFFIVLNGQPVRPFRVNCEGLAIALKGYNSDVLK
jgi:hypothetical protein